MKVCVIPPGKLSRSAEVVSEGKRNLEWIVEKDSMRTGGGPETYHRAGG